MCIRDRCWNPRAVPSPERSGDAGAQQQENECQPFSARASTATASSTIGRNREGVVCKLGVRHQGSRSSRALSGWRPKKWSDYSENRRHNEAPDADMRIQEGGGAARREDDYVGRHGQQARAGSRHKNRSRTSVVALKNDAAAEKFKVRLLQQYRFGHSVISKLGLLSGGKAEVGFRQGRLLAQSGRCSRTLDLAGSSWLELSQTSP